MFYAKLRQRKPRSELVSVDRHTELVSVVAQPARDHFDRLADIRLRLAQVGQLGGHQGALLQLDQRHRIGCGLVETGGGLVDRGVGVDFAAPAEEGSPYLYFTIRADRAGWDRRALWLPLRPSVDQASAQYSSTATAIARRDPDPVPSGRAAWPHPGEPGHREQPRRY